MLLQKNGDIPSQIHLAVFGKISDLDDEKSFILKLRQETIGLALFLLLLVYR